jgi:perosamine synthetase
MNKNTNPSKYLGNEMKYLKSVLNSESWSATSGSWCQLFEKEFAKLIGTKYAVAMNSGTATLHAALEAVGVGPGDEVITPALTVFMDTSAIIHANAVPVYADINPETFNITANEIRKKITPKTKAIIVVGIYGLSPDMDPIMEIANEHNLFVIEDNAQCLLNKYKTRQAGTIGHIASYSFENTKHLSCGEGGAIVTNDENLAEMCRKIGGHGFKNLRAEDGRIRLNSEIFQNPDYKRHSDIGWNYRLSEFGAAIAFSQLENAEELHQLRIDSANIFLDVIKEADFLVPQKTPKNCTNSYYTLGVLYKGDYSIGVSWAEFRKAYVDSGGDGVYGAWSIPYLEPVMLERRYVKRCPEVYDNIYYNQGICPVAEKIQKQLMQFKTNYRDLELAKEKAEILRKVIRKFNRLSNE